MKIVIIDYGAGNIQSIQYALNRLGFKAVLSKDPEEIRQADRVIFPGVGEASSAMLKLKETALDQLIPQLRQPVLGICLGMQLMGKYTQEGDTKGLGIFDVAFKAFPPQLKSPQIGWNTIFNLQSALFQNIPENAFTYLVHSYYAPVNPQSIAQTIYGKNYATAFKNKNFYGVQFHPEKSGKVGEQILSNFLNLKIQ